MALTIKTEAMKPVGFVLLSCVLCLSVNSVIDGSTYANFKVHNRVFELYTRGCVNDTVYIGDRRDEVY